MERCRAYNLTMKEIDEDYVQFTEQETRSPSYQEDRLQKEILRPKTRSEFREHNYIVQMQKTRMRQFFKYTVSGSKFKYLTGPHFSLGLHLVERGMEHVIGNHGHHAPLFLFTCRAEKAHLYRQHVDSCKVLVDQTAIETDFRMTRIGPGSTHTLPERSVYFLYSVTHALFSRERRIAPSTSSPASGYHFRHSSRVQPSADEDVIVVESEDDAASGSTAGEELRDPYTELQRENVALRMSHEEQNIQLREGLRAISQEVEIMQSIIMID